MQAFSCLILMVEQEDSITSETLASNHLRSFLSQKKNNFGVEGKVCLDLIANLTAAPQLELEELVAVHQVLRESRQAGGPWVGWRTPQLMHPMSLDVCLVSSKLDCQE